MQINPQLKNPENHVIATARKTTAEGLTELANRSLKGKLDIIKLDVLSAASLQEAVETVSKLLPNGLDIFISNAGADLQPLVPFEQLYVFFLGPQF